MNNKDPKLFPGKDLDTIQTNKQISNQKFYLLTYNLIELTVTAVLRFKNC